MSFFPPPTSALQAEQEADAFKDTFHPSTSHNRSCFQRENSKNNHPSQELSQLTISQVQFLEDLPTQTSPSHRSKQLNSLNSNAANIFRVKFGGAGQKKQKMTYIRYQNYTSARSRKTTEQKIYEINNFVKKLTDNINRQDQIPEISDTKFRALKKIIEYYDIKNLDRSEYANVIKSFGLQIGTMKAQEKKSYSFSQGKNIQRKISKPINSLITRTHKKLSSRDATFGIEAQHLIALQKLQPKQKQESAGSQLRRDDKMDQGSKLFSSLQMRKSKLREKSNKKTFKFSSGDNCIIEKVNKYREFLFILNYSNRFYRSMDLQSYPQTLKFYVGKGNNSNLIRSLMKKRFWFQQTPIQKSANLVWTQIKIVGLFRRQPAADELSNKIDKKIVFKSPTLPKNEALGRILMNQDYKQIIALQQSIKNKGIISFQQKVRLSTRSLKKEIVSLNQVTHNHLPGNGLLGNKKAMFYCLRQYYGLLGQDVFSVVPLTFIINNGLLDPQFIRMSAYFSQKKSNKKQNYWILKPGEFSNRGNGIECTNKLQDIRKKITKSVQQRKKGSVIVQQYLTKPLLYNGRKFDIRAYMMITYHNGKTKAYWYQQGYIRTSSHHFSLDQMGDTYIHLTNDAVQQHGDSYGRYQQGNKLSYPQLQRYLDSIPSNGRNLDLQEIIIPQMKSIATNAVRSTWLSINKQCRDKNFQLFGLDFMIDEGFKPWLIEINTNPCLQMSSPVLQRIIPYMVENVLRIGLDPIFPPPQNFNNNHKYNIPENSLHYNKFQVIFDSDRQGSFLRQLYQGRDIFRQLQDLQQDKNQYKQEGSLLNLQDL